MCAPLLCIPCLSPPGTLCSSSLLSPAEALKGEPGSCHCHCCSTQGTIPRYSNNYGSLLVPRGVVASAQILTKAMSCCALKKHDVIILWSQPFGLWGSSTCLSHLITFLHSISPCEGHILSPSQTRHQTLSWYAILLPTPKCHTKPVKFFPFL